MATHEWSSVKCRFSDICQKQMAHLDLASLLQHLIQNNASHGQVKCTVRKKPSKQAKKTIENSNYVFISKTTCSFALVHSVFLTEVKFFSGVQERFMTETEQNFAWQRGCTQCLLSLLQGPIALYFADTNIRPS